MRADTATRVTLGSAVSGSVTAFDVTISQDAEWLGILAVDFDSGEVVSPALYVVSRLTGAARKIAPAAAAAFSGDGRYIAILSQSRLTPDDHDDESDIVVYDQVTGTYDRVTVKTEAATGKDYGFVSLGGTTRIAQEEWAPASSAAQQNFPMGANKAAPPTVSMAVRHC